MAKKNNELSVITEMQDMFVQAQSMIDNKLVPSTIKKPADIVTIINKGQQLGMDPLTALNSMHVIQGNIALKSSVIPGLLAKAGVAVELIKDYEPVIERKASVIMEDGAPKIDENGNVQYYRGPDGEVLYKEKHKTFGRNNEHLEYVTTIRFHRYYKEMNKTISSDYSFYWSDAVAAQWNTKSNWKLLPRFMMYARCVVRGARGVASDVIGGLYDTHEVVEFSKAEFTIDPNTNDAIPVQEYE